MKIFELLVDWDGSLHSRVSSEGLYLDKEKAEAEGRRLASGKYQPYPDTHPDWWIPKVAGGWTVREREVIE